jgi:hypothetical protein
MAIQRPSRLSPLPTWPVVNAWDKLSSARDGLLSRRTFGMTARAHFTWAVQPSSKIIANSGSTTPERKFSAFAITLGLFTLSERLP